MIHAALELTVQAPLPSTPPPHTHTRHGTSGTLRLPPASDIWWSSMDTCSIVFTSEPPLPTGADIWWLCEEGTVSTSITVCVLLQSFLVSSIYKRVHDICVHIYGFFSGDVNIIFTLNHEQLCLMLKVTVASNQYAQDLTIKKTSIGSQLA